MFASWKVGRAFGIPLYIHWSFWLLPLWVVFMTADRGPAALGLNLAVLAAAFGCVLLHELGHALTARFYRIGTRDITLYPIGGVARLERPADRPAHELWITLAGPAVNLVIAVGLAALLFVVSLFDPVLIAESFAGQLLFLLIVWNVGMMVFNLVPAFPMDGGRVLRALLAMGLGDFRATRIAVTVGAVVSGLTMAAVLASLMRVINAPVLQNPLLMVIAFLVFLAGQAELQAAYFREHQRRLRAAEAEALHPPVATAPLFFLQPQVTVYTWDGQTGRWIKEVRGGTPPAV